MYFFKQDVGIKPPCSSLILVAVRTQFLILRFTSTNSAPEFCSMFQLLSWHHSKDAASYQSAKLQTSEI